MSSHRFQLSRIKPASIPFLAEETYQTLKYAPGNTQPLPPRPPERVSRRNMKLELADAEVGRCKWCGAQVYAATHCSTCKTRGYPTIDDLGETA